MLRRTPQLLVLSALAGCTEPSLPDIVVAFRVVDPLGERALDVTDVACGGRDLNPGATGDTWVWDEVEGGADGIHYDCRVDGAAEVVHFQATALTVDATLWLYPAEIETDVRDVVVWQPTVSSDIVGDVVTVSWGPLIEAPEPNWIRRVGFRTPVGNFAVDPDATSFEFSAEGLVGNESMTFWVRFDHPESLEVSREHNARVRLSSGPP